jgi:acyl-CoA synthetase (AMP-forming)/AMP-acid ligase II
MQMIEAPSLWDLIERRSKQTPEALFAIDERDRSLDFAGFRDAALRVAAGLAERGVREGTPVTWVLPTRLEALVLCAALARLGAVQNPVLPINGARELRFITRQTGARWLIVPERGPGVDHPAIAREIAAENDGLELWVAEPGLPEADPSGLPSWRAPSGDAPVRWVFYTSGTTAEPKGAQHSDATLLTASLGLARAVELTPQGRVGMVFPVTHIGGANWLMAGLASGAALILIERFDPTGTCDVLARHGVTHAGAGTVFHQAYLSEQRRRGDVPLFPNVRCFPGGGAPKPPQLHHDIKRELGGAGIVSGYGMTECPIISMNRLDDPDEQLAHSEGRANPESTVIRIVGANGSPVPTGEEGEVRVRAPQMCLGFTDPALGADAFDEDGFFRTGDLGRLDDAGYLTLTGRLKDVIIRKGENISALEVESLLQRHPNVADVAVIGLPDAKLGERCCAVVVASAEPAPPLEELVRHLLEAGLMKRKLPEQLEVVDTIPRNPSGKILKKELRARFG